MNFKGENDVRPLETVTHQSDNVHLPSTYLYRQQINHNESETEQYVCRVENEYLLTHA